MHAELSSYVLVCVPLVCVHTATLLSLPLSRAHSRELENIRLISMKNRFQGSKHTDFVKPSGRQKWGEKAAMPIFTKVMSKAEMDGFKMHLVESYGCEPDAITYDFQKIRDAQDEDRDDCIWLKYKLRCVVHGKHVHKEVFNLKIVIPEEIRKKADELRKNAERQAVTSQRLICESVEASAAATPAQYTSSASSALPSSPMRTAADISAEKPKLKRPTAKKL